MKKYIIIVLLIYTSNFYSQKNFYEFYKTYNLSDTITYEEGSYENSLVRLYKRWGERLWPHGDFSFVNKNNYYYYLNYNKGINSKQSLEYEYFDPNWRCIGPNNTPQVSPFQQGAEGTGRIHCIAFDPNYNGQTNKTVFIGSQYGGLWKTINDGQDWFNLNTDDLPHTSVSSIAIDTNNTDNIYISTGEADDWIVQWSTNSGGINPCYTDGVFRSSDGGETWEPINQGLFPDLLYYGGATRKIVLNPDNNNQAFITTSKGIYKTNNLEDDSPVWTNVFFANDDQFNGIEFKPNNPKIMFSSGKDIYKSMDNGDTWFSMTGPLTGLDLNNLPNSNIFDIQRINISVSNNNPEIIWAYIIASTPNNDYDEIPDPIGYLYKYNGNSWQLKNTISSNNSTIDRTSIAISPFESNKIFYGTQYFVGTYNDGQNFSTLSPYSGNGFHADVHAIEFPPINNNKVWVGHDGGISIKDLSNTSWGGWIMLNNGLEISKIWALDDFDFNNKFVSIGLQDCGALINTNYELNEWRNIVFADGYGVQIPDFNNSNVYLKANSNLYRYNYLNQSLNFENSLIPTDPIQNNLSFFPSTFKIEHYPQGQRDMYWGFSDVFKRKRDIPLPNETSLSLWEANSNLSLLEPENWKRQIKEMKISDINPNIRYIATHGGDTYNQYSSFQLNSKLFRTLNGGEPCNQGDFLSYPCYENLTENLPYYQTDPNNPNPFFATKPIITGIAIDPKNPFNIWLSFTGYDSNLRVWRSTDAGDTWFNDDPNGVLSYYPANNIVYQDGTNNRLYLATDVGIFTKDDYSDWHEYGDFPNVRVTELKINPCSQTIKAATYGRSLWEGDLIPNDQPPSFSYLIEDDFTVNEVLNLKSNLHIKNNSVLTINGNVNITPNSLIKIDNNCILNLNSNGVISTCKECGTINFIIDGGTLNIEHIENSLLYYYSFSVINGGLLNINGNICYDRIKNLNVEIGSTLLLNGQITNFTSINYNDLNLTGSISGIYLSSNSITTQNLTYNVSDTELVSGTKIELNQGFFASPDYNFYAHIDEIYSCDDFDCNSNQNKIVLSNEKMTYKGNLNHLYKLTDSELASESLLQNDVFNINIFPNPFVDSFNINFYKNDANNIKLIEIYNTLGVKLYTINKIQQSNKIKITTNEKILIIKIIDKENNTITKKIIKN